MSDAELKTVVDQLPQLGNKGCERILKDWHFWRHEYQDWNKGENETTTMVAGRGTGKNYVGANACHDIAKDWKPNSKDRKERQKYNGHMLICGRTESDVYDAMIHGESGIMATADPDFKPVYNRQTLSVTWPNGFIGHLRTGKNPDKIRSLNLCFVWIDEFAFFQHPEAAWNNIQFANRKGAYPEILVTTSPLPLQKLIDIMAAPGNRVMTASTFDNAENLNPRVLQRLKDEFEGTPLGDQELHGKIIALKSWALWRREVYRYIEWDELPELVKIVIGVDPASGTASKKSDETGIVAVGEDAAKNHYILADESIDIGSAVWGDIVVNLAIRMSQYAEVTIVGEINFGGDMVMTVIQLCDTYKALVGITIELEMTRAVLSKGQRAEIPAQRYRKGRVYHVGNPREFTKLEFQQCAFDPRKKRTEQVSPDRMDAQVHAQLALIGGEIIEDTGLDGWALAMAAERKNAS